MKTYSRWQLFKARLFGGKTVIIDECFKVTVWRCKGAIFVTDMEEIDPIMRTRND